MQRPLISSGGFTSTVNLTKLSPGLLVNVDLCRLELRIAQATVGARSQAARPAPLVFTTENAHVTYHDGALATPPTTPIVIVGPKSQFSIAGEISPRQLAVVAKGSLEMPLIELYTRGFTSSVRTAGRDWKSGW